MRWLVFGSKGWIGGMLVGILRDLGHEVIEPSSATRADSPDAVSRLLDDVCPDRVVSLVGRTHGPGYSTIDYLEQPGKLTENVRDNLFAPVVLGKECAARGLHLVYMGTGCIFTYDSDHPEGDTGRGFTEGDLPNFTGSAYSTVKGYTDRLMPLLFHDTALNVRIRMPITDTPHPRNFITKITSYDRICSMPNSMTVLTELLPILVDMAIRRVTGTINLTNPGAISHNEILEMYREIVDPAFTWKNFTYEEQATVISSGRSNNCLDTSRLQAMYPSVRSVHDAVRFALHNYAANKNKN